MTQADLIVFGIAIALYTICTFLFQAYLVLKSPKIGNWATIALTAAVLVHAVAISIRWYELEHIALASMFESLSFYVWVTAVVYLFTERKFGFKVLGAFVSPVALFFAVFASFHPTDVEPLVPALQSDWYKIYTTVHVMVAFLAYGFFTLAFIGAIIYILQERQLKSKRPHALYYRLPPLDSTQHISHVMVGLGFPALTISIVTGAVWANEAWGSFWSWDPKESLSLVLFLIYAIYLHARTISGWPVRRTSWILVLGFVGMLFTFLGVNLFIPGLHSYH